ncbi:hypothetical protein [Vibrio alginolyticus]|uniref:hypothetical protein n=1 Tax=Vibrio alginolyticus TaxID=663 RepID=UPI0006CAA53A|nr:hypothetical protein [Vibrio alginolyticus]KPM97500.1 hypothetical protein AOG25_13595 [Vibrio alginolyticus]
MHAISAIVIQATALSAVEQLELPFVKHGDWITLDNSKLLQLHVDPCDEEDLEIYGHEDLTSKFTTTLAKLGVCKFVAVCTNSYGAGTHEQDNALFTLHSDASFSFSHEQSIDVALEKLGVRVDNEDQSTFDAVGLDNYRTIGDLIKAYKHSKLDKGRLKSLDDIKSFLQVRQFTQRKTETLYLSCLDREISSYRKLVEGQEINLDVASKILTTAVSGTLTMRLTMAHDGNDTVVIEGKEIILAADLFFSNRISINVLGHKLTYSDFHSMALEEFIGFTQFDVVTYGTVNKPMDKLMLEELIKNAS